MSSREYTVKFFFKVFMETLPVLLCLQRRSIQNFNMSYKVFCIASINIIILVDLKILLFLLGQGSKSAVRNTPCGTKNTPFLRASASSQQGPLPQLFSTRGPPFTVCLLFIPVTRAAFTSRLSLIRFAPWEHSEAH